MTGSLRRLHCDRLRHRVGTIKEEDCNLLVPLMADIDGAVDAGARLVPIRLASRHLDAMGLPTITGLDREDIATHDHRDPMVRVTVPRCSFARRQM